MNTHVTDKNCIGCLACENICPHSAIIHDISSGFIRPIIDVVACVNCGLCLKVCPKDTVLGAKKFMQQAYAVKHTDTSVLNNSTSGGAFSALADYIISENGIVYGCVFENGKVQHIRAEKNYSSMRGSKYVQSDLKRNHIDVAKDLENGRPVLFTGTPCQCASVINFLSLKKIETTNLVLVDFVCHGTTSPVLFGEYISYCEKKNNKKIDNHLFRSKINGWTSHTEMNILSDGTKDYQSYESQLFKSIFHSHYGMNEGCFDCKFTSTNRVSDITLADFWGIKKSHSDLFDENGVSFVLINSNKGQNVFDNCPNIDKQLVSITDTDQPSLYKPAVMPEEYNAFWKDYRKKGFDYIVKKYYHGGSIHRILSYIYHKLLKG